MPATSTNPIMRIGHTGGGEHYYHRNQQYSIIALTDQNGNVKERYSYTAYGGLGIYDNGGTARATSNYDNRYTYTGSTGREWDETAELYHYRARVYDPLSGRFCSRDPIGYWGGSWCQYEFVGSRPLKALDPHGLQWSAGQVNSVENPLTDSYQAKEQFLKMLLPMCDNCTCTDCDIEDCKNDVRRAADAIKYTFRKNGRLPPEYLNPNYSPNSEQEKRTIA